jgi:S1-C subfamily serine protease
MTIAATLGSRDEAQQVAGGPDGEIVDRELGMSYRTLEDELAERLGYANPETRPEGVVITEIAENGPAGAAGLEPGDIIFRVERVRVRSAIDLRAALQRMDPERGIRLQILRDGARRFAFLRTR